MAPVTWRARYRHTRYVARRVGDELVWIVLIGLARQRWLTRLRSPRAASRP